MDPIILFLIYLFGLSFLAALLIVFAWNKLFRSRGSISRSLNLVLLNVRFPPLEQKDLKLEEVREKIALTEQLYTHLATLRDSWFRALLYGRPTFALELTIPSVGEELYFYIAVPRSLAPAVEKIIQGIFPEAIVEVSRDYNIFNPEGAAAGSRALFTENLYYPLRTYRKLEGDPLKQITNVFTKLAKEGEGAALQLIARPAPKHWKKFLAKRARLLMEGKKGQEVFLEKVVRNLQEAAGGPPPAPPPGAALPRPPDPYRPSVLEEELLKSLQAKAGKALFETNVRLLASAPDEARTTAILQGLELALAQFNDPNGNSLKIARAKRGTLKRLIFNYSFRSFEPEQALILGAEELTSLFHFPNVETRTPHVYGAKAREAPAPADLPEEGLLLGYNLFRAEERPVRMLEEDRRRHLYVIGQTGTGKSAFLQNLIVQDIRAGQGVCVIDPHGDLVARILDFVPRHRMRDVIYFDPGDVERPLGLNMLEYDPRYPEQKTFIVNELLSIFDKLYNMSVAGGPMFEQYFRNSTLLVMEDPASGNTMMEIQRVLTDKAYRDLKLSRTQNIVVKTFWQQIAEKAGGEASLQNMVPYVASKFDNFIANDIMRPIIAQEKSAFNFREAMDTGKILLVNLSKGRLGDLNSSLLGLIIVGKLLMSALSRVELSEEKRKDFYLYIDEFQNVTTDSIATILSEARKYRLDLTITHQFIGQLKDEIKKAVFGNVGSMVSFRIGSDDAEFMAKQYKPAFSEQDLLNLDNFHCYVKLLARGATTTPFSMRTYAPEEGNRELVETIRELSRSLYGRPRDEVEREIRERYQRPLP